jgi:hypothetical protein
MYRLREHGYPPDMGTMQDYTPLISPYPMSWPARNCNTCGASEITWAYPVGAVTFLRQVSADREPEVVQHHAQPWYACERCWQLVKTNEWDQLASELGKPEGFFRELAAAKSHAPGYRWRRR